MRERKGGAGLRGESRERGTEAGLRRACLVPPALALALVSPLPSPCLGPRLALALPLPSPRLTLALVPRLALALPCSACPPVLGFRGFERLLETGQLELYRQLCESVTAEFVAISQGVIAVEAALSGPLARPDLAQALRHVQLAEKEKLQLVRPAHAGPRTRSQLTAQS